MVDIIGVRFRSAGKVYYFALKDFELRIGDHVIVETARGPEYGVVATRARTVSDDMVAQPLRSVIRKATEDDEAKRVELAAREKEALRICREKIHKHNLEMKLVDAEYAFDENRVLFYFTADGRIDFRDLVKDLASVFHTRIELRQIGVRDETRMLGGLGICGRELCCATFLNDFAPVSIKMAKEQNLSLNPGKISGICGRLMCCLKNEEDTYEFLNQKMPKVGAAATTADGRTGKVIELNVLRQRVRVLFEENDSKEIENFSVDELTFTPRKRREETDLQRQGKGGRTQEAAAVRKIPEGNNSEQALSADQADKAETPKTDTASDLLAAKSVEAAEPVKAAKSVETAEAVETAGEESAAGALEAVKAEAVITVGNSAWAEDAAQAEAAAAGADAGADAPATVADAPAAQGDSMPVSEDASDVDGGKKDEAAARKRMADEKDTGEHRRRPRRRRPNRPEGQSEAAEGGHPSEDRESEAQGREPRPNRFRREYSDQKRPAGEDRRERPDRGDAGRNRDSEGRTAREGRTDRRRPGGQKDFSQRQEGRRPRGQKGQTGISQDPDINIKKQDRAENKPQQGKSRPGSEENRSHRQRRPGRGDRNPRQERPEARERSGAKERPEAIKRREGEGRPLKTEGPERAGRKSNEMAIYAKKS